MSVNPGPATPSSLSGSRAVCWTESEKQQDTAESFPLLPHMCRILNNNACEKYSCYSKNQQEVPSVSWEQFKCSDWSAFPPAFLTCNQERSIAVQLLAFILSVLCSMFAAGSPPERNKAGISRRASPPLQKTLTMFQRREQSYMLWAVAMVT